MNTVKLQFSDGRSDVTGVENVNAVLRSVGVRASTLPIPEEAGPILKASRTRAISEEEQSRLIAIFSLNRAELLEQIRLAGRTPKCTVAATCPPWKGTPRPTPRCMTCKR